MMQAYPATVRDSATRLDMQGFTGNDLIVRLNVQGDAAMPAVSCVVSDSDGLKPLPSQLQPGVSVAGRAATITFTNTRRYRQPGTVDVLFGDRIVLSGKLRFSRDTISEATTNLAVNVIVDGGNVVNVTVLIGASAGGGSLLPDLPLPITANGQTRWNIGGGELRRSLFFNGVKMTKGVDYSITLPYLDWLSGVPIDTSDELVLTN